MRSNVSKIIFAAAVSLSATALFAQELAAPGQSVQGPSVQEPSAQVQTTQAQTIQAQTIQTQPTPTQPDQVQPAHVQASPAQAAPEKTEIPQPVQQVVSPPSSMPINPKAGWTMENVRAKFGAPTQEVPAVGVPPISRWEYPGYVVFFEKDRVLHTVVVR